MIHWLVALHWVRVRILTDPNTVGRQYVSQVLNFSGAKLFFRWFEDEAGCLQGFEHTF